jgi:hypothetical protein
VSRRYPEDEKVWEPGDPVTREDVKWALDKLNSLISARAGRTFTEDIHALLLTLPEERFSMDVWWGRYRDPDPQENHECGTVACVAGHATTLPSVKALGLSLEDLGDGCVNLVYRARSRMPSARILHGTQAFAGALGLSSIVASRITLPLEYDARCRKHDLAHNRKISPQVAAQRLRALLDRLDNQEEFMDGCDAGRW